MEMKWTKGPWKMDSEGLSVWAEGTTTKICDIRGWGYLTGRGSGALGLDHEEAEAIQRANGAVIEAAPDLYEIGAELLAIFDHETRSVTALDAERLRAALAKARGETPKREGGGDE